jgi:hypothetical protein
VLDGPTSEADAVFSFATDLTLALPFWVQARNVPNLQQATIDKYDLANVTKCRRAADCSMAQYGKQQGVVVTSTMETKLVGI